uniref:Very long-chain specific acyl-CoA dehydrogenase, mitochondrial n=1 Tax=Cacopsylla melanoneura TaxID=428564 RepID=A0A8D8YJ76_9HEMI
MKKSRELVNIVKCRKLQYLGHIMRNPVRYELLQLILQGKIDSKRQPGRRRISWLVDPVTKSFDEVNDPLKNGSLETVEPNTLEGLWDLGAFSLQIPQDLGGPAVCSPLKWGI